MMGKRVNYCCRSVISPDNYIGTNEVGIPLHFAKNLHYPEPVNEYNVKHLRTLVERGPFEYPGKFCHASIERSGFVCARCKRGGAAAAGCDHHKSISMRKKLTTEVTARYSGNSQCGLIHLWF